MISRFFTTLMVVLFGFSATLAHATPARPLPGAISTFSPYFRQACSART